MALTVPDPQRRARWAGRRRWAGRGWRHWRDAQRRAHNATVTGAAEVAAKKAAEAEQHSETAAAAVFFGRALGGGEALSRLWERKASRLGGRRRTSWP